MGDHIFGDVIKAKKEQAWRLDLVCACNHSVSPWLTPPAPQDISSAARTEGGGEGVGINSE